jgi:hypothetical protein
MLCTWTREHGVGGTGIDMSQLFTEQARRRAEELGVADRVAFIHGDAAGYVADEPVGVAACVGATWIGGGVAGTIALLARSLSHTRETPEWPTSHKRNRWASICSANESATCKPAVSAR